MRRLFVCYPAPNPLSKFRKITQILTGAFLAPWSLLLATRLGVPGLRLRLRCAALSLALLFKGRGQVSFAAVFVTLFWPMDSTRYFEFDFVWRRAMLVQSRRCLDVSSPRLFPLMLLRKQRSLSLCMMNPDSRDLDETKRFVAALGLEIRCEFESCLIGDVPYPDHSFDLITCISVLEHIPDNVSAVRKMWALLKPGGRLFITVPCLARAAEQFVNTNPYGLSVPREEEFSFLQYYYDDSLLNQFIFRITGTPAHHLIYGEKVAGSFRRYVNKGVADPFKDRWKDPYRTGQEFKFYAAISELPGEGVIGMEFVRP